MLVQQFHILYLEIGPVHPTAVAAHTPHIRCSFADKSVTKTKERCCTGNCNSWSNIREET